MNKFCAIIFVAGLAISCAAEQTDVAQANAASTCAPLGLDKEKLMALRDAEFALDDTQDKSQFLMDLVDCLGDPDPDLRDKIGYEGAAALLRGASVDTQSVKAFGEQLMAIMEGPNDVQGFRRPFAALVLSEVARHDRVNETFTTDERQRLIDGATHYLINLNDYRGYDETVGWRHGVAHSADILMQLTLNPALDKAQLLQIRDAISRQAAPDTAHFYIYGEGERLARPIIFAARRGLISQEEWAAWFAGLADPAPLDKWGDIYSSQMGLAKKHNTYTFVSTIYLNASASQNENIKVLADPALQTLIALP